MKKNKTGLIHIYTGDGNGKTTSAIGLGVRAQGYGMKVLMVQFLKGRQTGELEAVKKFGGDFKIIRHKEIKKFTNEMSEAEMDEIKTEVRNLFKHAACEASCEEWDLMILDEIMACISLKFISTDEVIQFIKNKPEKLELVMTGRNAPEELIAVSDYVSEIKMIKHPIESGIPARAGIEF